MRLVRGYRGSYTRVGAAASNGVMTAVDGGKLCSGNDDGGEAIIRMAMPARSCRSPTGAVVGEEQNKKKRTSEEVDVIRHLHVGGPRFDQLLALVLRALDDVHGALCIKRAKEEETGGITRMITMAIMRWHVSACSRDSGTT